MKMNKVYEGEFTKVLISPGFGAGWSTWNYDIPELLFDPVIVSMVEDGTSFETIEAYCTAKYSTGYFGGSADLEVRLIKTGSEFIVHEYDGAESIQLKDEFKWVQA
jgi:hypothetical protein